MRKKCLQYLLLIWMTLVILFIFLTPIDIKGLEGTTRNIFFHVSMAITATIAYLLAAYYGFKYLQTKNKFYDVKLIAAIQLGFLFSILSTTTGAVWAKFTWGSFWHWDPRQTSSFILLLLYATLLMLRTSIKDEEKSSKLSSVYALFSFFPMIFLMFILPRLLPGLHPGSDEGDPNPAVSLTTDIEIKILLYASWLGFIFLFLWMHNLKCRELLLKRNL